MTLPHDSWAAHYEAVMELTFRDLYARLTSSALDEVRARLRPPASIVDFGAGCGRLSIPLASEGYRVTAVEPSLSMLDQLHRRSHGLDVETVHQSMQAYRTDHPHALALCVFTVIAYLLEPDSLAAAFDAVAASLMPGGLFLLDVPDASVFEGFDCDTGDLIGHVEIERLEDSIYDYRENTVLRSDRGPVSYQDRFQIRHWTRDEVFEALSGAGFETEADVTTRFADHGAEYLLLRSST